MKWKSPPKSRQAVKSLIYLMFAKEIYSVGLCQNRLTSFDGQEKFLIAKKHSRFIGYVNNRI